VIPILGDSAPSIQLISQQEQPVSFEDYKDQWIVLYFYPKDDTPGCTIEANDFSRLLSEFTKINTVVLGISPDHSQSHQKFCNKYKLTVTLLSDPELKVLKKYGVWQLKKNYGKEYWGVMRSTFLLSPERKIVYLWSPVKAEGHALAVLDQLKLLQKK